MIFSLHSDLVYIVPNSHGHDVKFSLRMKI